MSEQVKKNRSLFGLRSNKRLVLEIDELLNDVNDFMWLWHGRPIWIWRKLLHAPKTVTNEDRSMIENFLKNMPDVAQLTIVRQLIESQLPCTKQRKERMVALDRAIYNTRHGMSFLTELLYKIEQLLKEADIPQRNPSISNLVWEPCKSPISRAYRSRKIIHSLMNQSQQALNDPKARVVDKFPIPLSPFSLKSQVAKIMDFDKKQTKSCKIEKSSDCAGKLAKSFGGNQEKTI